MDKMLMAMFKPTTGQWDENQPGYHSKAFHLVLNKYHRNDSIDPHQDLSTTYDGRNPITSLSYGRGSSLDDHRFKQNDEATNSPVLPIPW